MQEKKSISNKQFSTENESNFVLFNLNVKASRIKSNYLIKDCINALSQFIENSKVGYSL